MKNKKIFRTFAALCTCLMLMGGFSVTAFAQGTDPAPTATPAADATNDSNVVVEETEGNFRQFGECTKDGEYYGYAVLARKIGQIIHDTVEVDTSRATEPIFSKTLF